MGLKIVWDLFKRKESDHERKLRELKEEKEVKQAQLSAAEVDQDVVRAVRINRIMTELTRGVKTYEDQEKILRTIGKSFEGINELSAELTAEKKLDVLKTMDNSTLDRLERVMTLEKKKQQLLGFEEGKKSFRRSDD